MKKTTAFALILACLLAFGGGAAQAVGLGAQTKAISEQAALEIACADAGVQQDALSRLRCKTDREDGALVYEIKFRADGVSYEYTIDALDGTILEKDFDRLPTLFRPSAGTAQGAQRPATQIPADTGATIGMEKAKAIVLEQLGLVEQEDDFVFTKARRELEKGRRTYELVIFVPGEAEYSFEINAVSGEILEADMELPEPDEWQD